MSNLLEDLKAAVEKAGYTLEDVFSCICRIIEDGAEPPWNKRAMLVKPKCFFEAASKVEYDPAGGDEENHVWVVDPLICAIMKDETRFYWGVCNGIEQWVKRPNPKIGRHSPLVDVPVDKIALKMR